MLRALFFVTLFVPIGVQAQVSLAAVGTPVVVNFNGNYFGGTWTNGTTIPNCYSNRTSYFSSNGSNNTGALHVYGSGTEFALGGRGSNSTTTIIYGVRFRNNTGCTITSLDISFRNEQWGRATAGSGGSNQIHVFSYRTSATPITSVTSGVFTTGPTSLRVTVLNNNSSCGGSQSAINGNTTFTVKTGTIAVTLNPGDEIMLRWTETNDGCNDHNMGIDDLTVTPNAGGGPNTLTPPATVSGCSPFNPAQITGTGGFTSYQWQQSTASPTGPFTNIGGATAQNFDPGSLTQTTYFRRQATDCGGTTTSNVVTLTLNAPPTVDAGPDVIYCTDLFGSLNGSFTGAPNLEWLPQAGIFYSDAFDENTPVFPSAGGTYTLTAQVDVPGCPIVTDNVTITFLYDGTNGLWTGLAGDQDWNNCENWDDGTLPTGTTDVVIPSTAPNTPNNVPSVFIASFTLDNALGIQFAPGSFVGISGSISLQNGLVNANGGNLATVQSNPATLTNFGPSSYVFNGGFIWQAGLAATGVDFPFPVGDATTYRQLNWERTGPITGSWTFLRAAFDATNPTGAVGDFEGTPGLYFTEAAAEFQYDWNGGYWTVEPFGATGATDYNVTVLHNSGGNFCGGPCDAFTLFKTNGSGVLALPVPGSPNFAPPFDTDPDPIASNGQNAAGQVQRTGYSDFSDFVLVGSPITLPFPVELLAFNATLQNNHVDLTWETAAEINTDHFVVERSLNQQTYTEVAQLPAAGNTASVRNYATLDTDLPSQNQWYYRLKTVDTDGSTSFSNVVEVRRGAGTPVSLAAYPNPANEQLTLTLVGAPEASVSLYNAVGQVVRQATITGTEMLDINNLAAGTYLLRAQVGEEMLTERIVKR